MPVLSMFYGIKVMMFAFDNRQHHLPHIHVQCWELAINGHDVPSIEPLLCWN